MITDNLFQVNQMAKSGTEAAIFPLAVPSIASLGAMLAAVLLTENNRYNLWERAQTAAVMLSVLLIVLALLFAASWIYRLIGNSGSSIISRVMGLILSSVAASSVLAGFKEYFLL